MVINTNMAAITSASNLDKSTNELNNALAQLSSGSKITSPADDPAGLAESVALNAEIGQTQAANNNVSNAISFSQTQDGYLQQVGSALDQMSTLAVEAQDPTKTTKEIADYDAEFSALGAYINNTANATFNGVSLFASSGLTITTDGTSGATFTMTSVNLGTGTSYATAAGDHITSATVAARR